MVLSNWVMVFCLVIGGWYLLKLLIRRTQAKLRGEQFFKGDGYAWLFGLLLLVVLTGALASSMWVFAYLIRIKS